jgi:putative membrane protein
MKYALIIIFALTTIWSAINPHDMFTWWLEAAPALLSVAILFMTYKKLPLTNLLYIFLTIHGLILLVGAHYTYAEVPLFDWLKEALDLSRNHYDRVGHFAQGFVPALVARELLIRTSPLHAGKWLFAIVTLGSLGISAIYELIEWGVSVSTGEAAESFLGTQGDVWDTQKDMLFALIGAILAQLLLAKKHDEQIAKLV